MAPAAASGSRAGGLFEAACLGFLASHIPITLLVDGQALLPAALYTWGPRDALSWYLGWSRDPLMGAPPLWFRAVIAGELTLQVPFFFAALAAFFAARAGGAGSDIRWLRVPAIAYGAHTATTMIPILATCALADAPGLGPRERAVLVAIYLPYLIMPLAILWRAAVSETVFQFSTAATKPKSR